MIAIELLNLKFMHLHLPLSPYHYKSIYLFTLSFYFISKWLNDVALDFSLAKAYIYFF